MQATPEELNALFEIQSIDLDLKRRESEFAELPERMVILNAREKRVAIEQKREKIDLLKKETKRKAQRISDEDSSLEKKENGVQAAIEAAGNDYRSAEARTKELDGIFRRRGVLKEEMEAISAELAKIQALEKQIDDALANLDATEEKATQDFKAKGTALQKSIAEAKARHSEIIDNVSADVANLYERTSKQFDTVFIGYLEGSQCSVCRSRIDTGRLIDLKSEAPLSSCPSCKRLLIIKDL